MCKETVSALGWVPACVPNLDFKHLTKGPPPPAPPNAGCYFEFPVPAHVIIYCFLLPKDHHLHRLASASLWLILSV